MKCRTPGTVATNGSLVPATVGEDRKRLPLVQDPKEGGPAGPIQPTLASGKRNGRAADTKGNLHVLITYGTAGISGRTEANASADRVAPQKAPHWDKILPWLRGVIRIRDLLEAA